VLAVFLGSPRVAEILTGTIHGARYERENKSESYVEIPPAFLITDSDCIQRASGSIQSSGRADRSPSPTLNHEVSKRRL
jgi:hypothetical protein